MREIWHFCPEQHMEAKESRQQATANRPARDFSVGDKVELKDKDTKCLAFLYSLAKQIREYAF